MRGNVPTLQVAGTAEPHGGLLRLLVTPCIWAAARECGTLEIARAEELRDFIFLP